MKAKTGSDRELIQLIDEAVNHRDTKTAIFWITRLTKRHPNDFRVLSSVLEWYRRLGLYREGFRICVRALKDQKNYTPLQRQELTLWTARLFDWLGMGFFALGFVRNTNPRTAREHQYIAEIFLSEGAFAEAIPHYKKSIDLEKHPDSREARITRIGLADALVDAGRIDEAIDIVETERGRTQEAVALGVIFRCLGEYHARKGNYRKALGFLDESNRQMPSEDKTADRAIWCKWYGYALARSGKRARGLRWMQEGETLLLNAGVKVTAVFDIRALRHEIEPLDPEELLQIRHYPGLSKEVLDRFPKVEGRRATGLPDPDWVLDLASDEYGKRIKAGALRWKLGIPIELKLLAYLKLARPMGLSRLWCIGLLWPDDALSLLQLESRLDQLILRLRRRYDIHLTTNALTVALAASEWTKIDVSTDGSAIPRLARENGEMTVPAMMKYYGLSRAQAYRYLKRRKAAKRVS